MIGRKLVWACVSLLSITATGQDPERLLAELGDPKRSEAAELALIGMGAGACDTLTRVFDGYEAGGENAQARLRAALRVVNVLGVDAAEVSPNLVALNETHPIEALIDLISARASLAPYGPDKNWQALFHKNHHLRGKISKSQFIESLHRFWSRLTVSDRDEEQMLDELLRNSIFKREVAAEVLGRAGYRPALAPLRAMLLDRVTRPEGWDGLIHNGFVAPLEDQFRWRAAEAILRLVPDDPRSAIAWACRALHHPYRRVRRDAVQSLARFGPSAREALPELIEIACGDDPEAVIGALKLLGMFGTEVGDYLAAIDTLATHKDRAIAGLALSLSKRLRAMGAETPPKQTASEAELGENKDKSAALLGELTQRLRIEKRKLPKKVLRRIVELGVKLDASERETLSMQILMRSGEYWRTSMMSSAVGAWGASKFDQELYAELIIGDPGLRDLVNFLKHSNAVVRFAAARRIAAVPTKIASDQRLREDLLAAVIADHPKKCEFKIHPSSVRVVNRSMDDAIHAAAATALVESEVPKAMHALLLSKIAGSTDSKPVIAAIGAWGATESLSSLKRLAKSKDEGIAAAAKAVINRLK